MPFTRRTRRRRRPRRSRPSAMRAVRRLARFVDTELNQAIFIGQGIDVQFTGSFLDLVQISQGDDDNNRHGLQVTMRSIAMRFHVAIGNQDSCLRVILLVDKQSNGAVPTVADVLQITTGGTDVVTTPTNNDNKKRFTILSDRVRILINGHSDLLCFPLRKKLTHKIRFDGVGQAIDDVVSGAVFLLLLSDQTTVANAPTVAVTSRAWFAP